MNFFPQSKKGVSPLIATFLLIFFAAALGLIVINFGRAQLEVAAHCSIDVGLKTAIINKKEQVCYDPEKQQLFFIVENGPNIRIEKLRIQIIGKEKIYAEYLPDSSIDKATSHMRYVPYGYAVYGDIRQIKLTPVIRLYQDEIICPEQALIIEKIRECEK